MIFNSIPALHPTDADPPFSSTLIDWQKRHGRHALPWQNTRDAYRIWLSEIMLQQTQVTAVIPYYQRFLQTFPDIQSLAAASLDDVMTHWSGLGYYSRARNLHRCAQQIAENYAGVFPADPVLLAQLPGIGRSTAAAISAFAYGTRAAILDGNVKRVFARVFGIDGFPGEKRIENAMWQRAEVLLPAQEIERYTQGLMDLGATICKRGQPLCAACPMASRCVALASGRVRELPTPKPKKAVPQKQTAMLLIVEGNQILLERRPAHGVWGGLLSLPEIALDESLDTRLTQAVNRFGDIGSLQRLPAIEHGFTHFKLQIVPYRIDLSQRAQQVAQGTHAWYRIDELMDAALPAPIKKLLLGVFASGSLI